VLEYLLLRSYRVCWTNKNSVMRLDSLILGTSDYPLFPSGLGFFLEERYMFPSHWKKWVFYWEEDLLFRDKTAKGYSMTHKLLRRLVWHLNGGEGSIYSIMEKKLFFTIHGRSMPMLLPIHLGGICFMMLFGEILFRLFSIHSEQGW